MIIKFMVPYLSNFIKYDYRLLRNIGDFTSPSHYYCTSSDVTAGILIIGDEILKGITDINTPFLIKQLNELNIKIKKVSIVPDDIDVISQEVCELSTNCSFVFTSGGIGPTHDDVTYEAVAKACKDELLINRDLFNFLVNYFGPESEKNPAIVKYSHVPKSAIVNYLDLTHNNRKIKFPIVSVKNIYMFPGVPMLLQKCFNMLKSRFIIQNQTKCTKYIYIDLDEFTIINILNESVKKFENVKFGSYPTLSHNYYKIKLALESSSQDKIEEAYRFLLQQLPERGIVNIKNEILLTAKDDVYSLHLHSEPILSATSVIEEAMKNYTLSELCVCFNGGKDCTAVLHLLYACVQNLKPSEWNKIQFLYIRNGECFEEIETFIAATVKQYNFRLTTLEGDLKHALCHYLETNGNVKAMFMGTRKCDPGTSNLNFFSATDSDWPPVVRILPVLSWSYSDVWYFIRKLQLPYCTLYDRGYTSLGVQSQTIQNPALLQHNHKGYQSYKPAYMLQDSENERNSRL